MISNYEKYISSYPHIMFIALIVLCHMNHISYVYAAGYVVNILVNYGLKLGFREIIGSTGNRPVPYHPANQFVIRGMTSVIGRANAYGFPSGHAQSVGYFLAFLHQFLPWRAWHPGWIFAALAVAAWLLHTRIAFQRHTPAQVLFGFAFGIAVFRLIHSLLIKN
jgi:membrane-associated phospholipid phosphatase